MTALDGTVSKISAQNCGLFPFTAAEASKMAISKFRRSVEEEVRTAHVSLLYFHVYELFGITACKNSCN